MIFKSLFSLLVMVQFTLCPIYGFGQQIVNFSIGYPDQIVLNVTEDLSTSMAFSWRTDFNTAKSKLQIVEESSRFDIANEAKEYEANAELLDFKDIKTWHHSLLIDGLKENTYYAYRVGTGEKWSEWLNFRTAGARDKPLKFIYFGDVQSNVRSLWSRVLKQAIRTVPDAQLILNAGDLINRGNNLNEWEEWFYASANVHSNIPIMPAAGNHDHGESAQGDYNISEYWNRQFNLPKNGPENVWGSCYFADIQNVRFIVLNTEMFNTYEDSRVSQIKWLEDKLKNNTKKWTIMLFHHPIYSTKKNRDNVELRNLVKPLIDKYRVDLVLQGHDHTYARGMEKIPMEGGTTSQAMYVVSVAGPKMYEPLEADWMDKSVGFTQLFHGIEINNNRLIFSTYKVNGELFDHFEIHKVNGRNKLIQ